MKSTLGPADESLCPIAAEPVPTLPPAPTPTELPVPTMGPTDMSMQMNDMDTRALVEALDLAREAEFGRG